MEVDVVVKRNRTGGTSWVLTITSWWLKYPIEKYARQIGSFLQGSGLKIKNV